MRMLLGPIVVMLSFSACVPKKRHSDPAATPSPTSATQSKGFCELDPLTGKDIINPTSMAATIGDEIKLAMAGISEDEARNRVAVWRSICGPMLKKTLIYGNRWNFHTGVCRYNETSGEIISEGQISHSVPLRFDTQSYFGFRYKKSASGWQMMSSYLYSTDQPKFKDLYETAQNPALYELFRRGCEKLKGESCPLPNSAQDMIDKISFIQNVLNKAASYGHNTLETAGIKMPNAAVVKPGSAEDALPAMVEMFGLSCLQQASTKKSSIGINAKTEMVTIYDQLEYVIKTQLPVKRIAMFGHHWNIKPVHTEKDGTKIKVCGQISRNISFNDDDQIYFKAEFDGDTLVNPPEIITKKGSLIASTSTYAIKALELYNRYSALIGQQKIYLPVSTDEVNALLELGRNTNQIVYGNQWEKAASELVQVLAILAKEERPHLEEGCPEVPKPGQW